MLVLRSEVSDVIEDGVSIFSGTIRMSLNDGECLLADGAVFFKLNEGKVTLAHLRIQGKQY